jgi:hypothetical protein
MHRPTTDIIRDHYAEIALELARLVGYPESGIAPGVDLEAVPDAAVRAGRVAVDCLIVAAGILDGDIAPLDRDADAALARWTRP